MDLGGWEVLTAGSLLEGLRQAVLHPPDAIILELSRTGMDELGFWNNSERNRQLRRFLLCY
jgi:hypothetical protein